MNKYLIIFLQNNQYSIFAIKKMNKFQKKINVEIKKLAKIISSKDISITKILELLIGQVYCENIEEYFSK